MYNRVKHDGLHFTMIEMMFVLCNNVSVLVPSTLSRFVHSCRYIEPSKEELFSKSELEFLANEQKRLTEYLNKATQKAQNKQLFVDAEIDLEDICESRTDGLDGQVSAIVLWNGSYSVSIDFPYLD